MLYDFLCEFAIRQGLPLMTTHCDQWNGQELKVKVFVIDSITSNSASLCTLLNLHVLMKLLTQIPSSERHQDSHPTCYLFPRIPPINTAASLTLGLYLLREECVCISAIITCKAQWNERCSLFIYYTPSVCYFSDGFVLRARVAAL